MRLRTSAALLLLALSVAAVLMVKVLQSPATNAAANAPQPNVTVESRYSQEAGNSDSPLRAPSTPSQRESPTAPPSEAGCTIEVVVLRTDGTSVPSPDGFLSIELHPETRDLRRADEIPFKGGEVLFECSGGIPIHVNDVIVQTLSGAVAIIESPTALRPSERVLIKCLEISGSTIDILDARSLEHLSRAFIYEAPPKAMAPYLTVPPSSIRDSASEVDVPVHLDSHRYDRSLWISARGYAWTRVAIPGLKSGAFTIVLDPESSVDALASTEVTGSHVFARAYAREPLWRQAPVAEAPSNAGMFKLEGLRPGNYTLRLQSGPWYESDDLGELDVELLAGHNGTLTIPLASTPTECELAGMFIIHESWVPAARLWKIVAKRASSSPKDRPLEENLSMSGLGKNGLALSWDLGPVPCDDYWLEVEPIGFRQACTVGAEYSSVNVILPELSQVELRIIDSASGEVIPISWYSWASYGDFVVPTGAPAPTAKGRASTEFAAFWCPVGNVDFMAKTRTHGIVRDTVVVGGKTSAQVIVAHAPATVTLELRTADGTPLSAPSEWWSSVWSNLSGDGHLLSLKVLGQAAQAGLYQTVQLQLDRPGSYSVSMPPLEIEGDPSEISFEVTGEPDQVVVIRTSLTATRGF